MMARSGATTPNTPSTQRSMRTRRSPPGCRCRRSTRPASPRHRDQTDPPRHPHRRLQHRAIPGSCDHQRHRLLRVTLNDDDGVIGVDDDRVMRTAPLGVVSGAVVGVVTGCPSG